MLYFRLAERDALTVEAGTEFTVAGGRAWITVEGEPNDWFVGPGERFVAPRGRRTVVQADPQCVIGMRAGARAALRALLRAWPRIAGITPRGAGRPVPAGSA
jgi:hypothetical protein